MAAQKPRVPVKYEEDDAQEFKPAAAASNVFDNLNLDGLLGALKDADLSSMMGKIGSNPDEIKEMVNGHLRDMPPEMVQKIKAMATSGQADGILKELASKGVDKDQIMELIDTHASKGGLKVPPPKDVRLAVLVTQSRQLKAKKLNAMNVTAGVLQVLRCTEPRHITCDRIAVGPLAGKKVQVWFDPAVKAGNRRAIKILSRPIGGDVLFLLDDEDLSVADFTTAEAMAVKL